MHLTETEAGQSSCTGKIQSKKTGPVKPDAFTDSKQDEITFDKHALESCVMTHQCTFTKVMPQVTVKNENIDIHGLLSFNQVVALAEPCTAWGSSGSLPDMKKDRTFDRWQYGARLSPPTTCSCRTTDQGS